jgi:hypothetical protein
MNRLIKTVQLYKYTFFAIGYNSLVTACCDNRRTPTQSIRWAGMLAQLTLQQHTDINVFSINYL